MAAGLWNDFPVTDDWLSGMYNLRQQRTLATTAAVRGVGYWSGEDVTVEFRPSAENTGIVFVRSDLPDCPRIPATVEHRTEIPRRTVLRSGEASVEMIEHVMASLAGMQIDNCEVWVDRAEIPGCDGSALPFVDALDAAGVVEQSAPRGVRFIRQTIRLGTQQSWIEARPCHSGQTLLQYELDYGSSGPIGRQSLEVSLKPRHFRNNLAPCRTFLLEAEAVALRTQGLAPRATAQDLLVFGPKGPIDNELRFPDECVRHKLLDMIGDLAMAGTDLVGYFLAYRSGHRLNAELVRAIVAQEETTTTLRRAA
jgi:UDP-3-O-acyl N-acetylglucosamine deacetylase